MTETSSSHTVINPQWSKRPVNWQDKQLWMVAHATSFFHTTQSATNLTWQHSKNNNNNHKSCVFPVYISLNKSVVHPP